MEEAFEQTAVQDSHITHQPSLSRDSVPSASGDRAPASIVRDALPSIQFSSSHPDLHRLTQQHHEEDTDVDDTDTEITLETSPHPLSPRKSQRSKLPPLPDLRFEQSYLKQLEGANGSIMWMIIITIREQILFPGLQGFLWALGMAGLRSLRAAQAENGRVWGGWLRELFGQARRTDTTLTNNRIRR